MGATKMGILRGATYSGLFRGHSKHSKHIPNTCYLFNRYSCVSYVSLSVSLRFVVSVSLCIIKELSHYVSLINMLIETFVNYLTGRGNSKRGIHRNTSYKWLQQKLLTIMNTLRRASRHRVARLEAPQSCPIFN